MSVFLYIFLHVLWLAALTSFVVCLCVSVNFTVMHKMEAGSVCKQIAWPNVPQRTVEFNFPTAIRLTRRIGGVPELSNIIFAILFSKRIFAEKRDELSLAYVLIGMALTQPQVSPVALKEFFFSTSG